MLTIKRGILLAIEGIDGSGKSTLARTLAERLTAHRLPTVLTKEPGGTALGKQLRTLLQERSAPISAKAEFFLFAADRAQHMEEHIQPLLAQNTVVISDRMADSALVYQGYGRGLDKNMIDTVNRWAMNTKRPDLTLYVKVDVDTAITRIAQRNEALTSFEREKKDFFARLVHGFDELYAQRNDVRVLDGTQSSMVVANQAYEELMTWMKQCDLLR